VLSSPAIEPGRSQLDAEVVIVGGGPAGLATGIFLCQADARWRGRVAVLEKESYPRDKFCAGGIGARADRLLESVGIQIDVPSVPVAGASLRFAGGTLCVREGQIGRVVRRLEYDHALANAARRSGVVVHEGVKVSSLERSLQGATLGTNRGSVRARVVVGADGVGSFVRRALGLPVGRLRAQVIELDTEGARGDPARDLLHFDVSERRLSGYTWDFPTVVDGESLMCRGIYHLRLDDDPLDIHAMLAERLADKGLDIGRYRLKRFAERGFALHEPFAAPGVLLVGEAAGIDPLTGEGIAQAIRYGHFAGRYLAAKLQQGDLGFSDFQRRLTLSGVGRELAIRSQLMPYFYGRRRAYIERFLQSSPEFVGVGLQHFAGRRMSRRKIARSLWSAAWHAVREAV
jgi:flavin-dependent dehydrogenase